MALLKKKSSKKTLEERIDEKLDFTDTMRINFIAYHLRPGAKLTTDGGVDILAVGYGDDTRTDIDKAIRFDEKFMRKLRTDWCINVLTAYPYNDLAMNYLRSLA